MKKLAALGLCAYLAFASSSVAAPRDFVGYYPSWLDAPVKPLDKTSALYSHVVVAFARPDFSWNGRDWRGTGLQFSQTPAALRDQIATLHKHGTRVLLAVGGATYRNWGPLAAERDRPGVITAAFARIQRNVGFDGLEVDYERNGTSSQLLGEYRAAIDVLRDAARGKFLSLAAWSTGADCTTLTGLEPCGGKSSNAGGSAGRERMVLRDAALRRKIDMVNVMSYDAGVTEFDPVTSWSLYRALFPAKVIVNIGFEIAPEGWGGASLVEDDAAAICASAMVAQNQFGETVQETYSVQRGLRDGPLRQRVNAQDGAMLWHMAKVEGLPLCGTKSAAAPESLERAAKIYLGR